MARVLHTRTEVHQNRVVVQGGIRDQAYREGSPEVESLAGVLACQVALNQNHQGDLTANRETFPIRFFFLFTKRTWRHHSDATTSRHPTAGSDR